jgi:NADH-quinone oxidoreductase subunit E
LSWLIAIESLTGEGTVDEDPKAIRQAVRQIVKNVGRKKGQLVPILQEIQRQYRYLPREAMLEVARALRIPEMDVYSVVTFYNQFRLNPPGEHCVRVCTGTACHMKGGYIVLDAWKRRLGVEPGQTTLDRKFDLDSVACVGACAMAPVTVVDGKVEAKTSPTRVDGILLSIKLQGNGKEGGEKKCP